MNRAGHVAAGLEFLAAADALGDLGYRRGEGECLWGAVCEAINAISRHP